MQKIQKNHLVTAYIRVDGERCSPLSALPRTDSRNETCAPVCPRASASAGARAQADDDVAARALVPL